MALLQEWHKIAYNEQQSQQSLQKFWNDYFKKEQAIYAELLKNPNTEVKGTVKGTCREVRCNRNGNDRLP